MNERILRERTREDVQREKELALADAAALDRLAATPEWAVLDRLLGEHADRVLLALRTRGVDAITTEALRGELDAIEWLRYRPIALRRAIEDQKLIDSAAQSRAEDGRDG